MSGQAMSCLRKSRARSRRYWLRSSPVLSDAGRPRNGRGGAPRRTSVSWGRCATRCSDSAFTIDRTSQDMEI